MPITDRVDPGLWEDKRTNLQIAQELAGPLGIKVHGEKDELYWDLVAKIVAMSSDISAEEFKTDFTQTFWDDVFLSERLLDPGRRWNMLCTLPHESRHSFQFGEDKLMATKYPTNTAFRTKMEADASVCNLTMRMWRFPFAARGALIDSVVHNIRRYSIKESDGEVLHSMLTTHVDIIDQGIAMHNIALVSKPSSIVIDWLVENGYAIW